MPSTQQILPNASNYYERGGRRFRRPSPFEGGLMAIEKQEQVKTPIPAPGPCPGDFEVWLDKQQDRDDETGAVARWIIRDLIEGRWPSTTSLWGLHKRDHESRWRYWRAYLQREHNVYRNMDLFEAAFKEYVEADKRYGEWRTGEFIRQQGEIREMRVGGGTGFWPDVPGDTETVAEASRFWAWAEREKEARKQSR